MHARLCALAYTHVRPLAPRRFGPVSWLLISELFPLEVRGGAMAFAVANNFACNLVVRTAIRRVSYQRGGDHFDFVIFELRHARPFAWSQVSFAYPIVVDWFATIFGDAYKVKL